LDLLDFTGRLEDSAEPLAKVGEADAGPEGDTANRSLFQQEWWLDAAGAGQIERVEVVWDALTVAILPFLRSRIFGLRTLGMPRYTRTLGAILQLPDSSAAQRRKNVARVTRELIAALPKHDRFFQLLDPLDPSAFAYSLAGCEVGQHFTFRVARDADLAATWNDIHSSKRRLIRSAEKEFSISSDLEIDDLLRLLYDDIPKERNHHNVAVLQDIYEACRKRSQATILGVLNDAGRAVAAVALVWDATTLYFWTPARNRAHTGGRENCFLLWNAIKLASRLRLNFDFDSYLSPASANFLASFGADIMVRPRISHNGLVGKMAELAKQGLRKVG
jgi:hypothetical protein